MTVCWTCFWDAIDLVSGWQEAQAGIVFHVHLIQEKHSLYKIST